MKLIKWMMYGLLGWIFYEFWCGLTGQRQMTSGASRSGRGRNALNQALNQNQGRYGALTGGGVGREITAEDADGATARHRVGRGVVHR
jgi:hypothetical protein